MDNNIVTVLETGLLVIVGIVQAVIFITQTRILKAQRHQNQLELIEKFRQRWVNIKRDWGIVIFLGRDEDEYYQVVSKDTIKEFIFLESRSKSAAPTVWALDAARSVFTNLSYICTKILLGQLDISDIYPVFGTELLRHSRPLRVLLDTHYPSCYYGSYGNYQSKDHFVIRKEIQDWLIYHDGIRRRSLILIDLLWAEAARLEDLPPQDIKSAADAKVTSGKFNRRRLIDECKRLNRYRISFIAFKLSRFLKNSEYRRLGSQIGVDKKRLEKLDKEWTERLLDR